MLVLRPCVLTVTPERPLPLDVTNPETVNEERDPAKFTLVAFGPRVTECVLGVKE